MSNDLFSYLCVDLIQPPLLAKRKITTAAMAKIVSDTVYEPRQLPEAEMKQLAHDVFRLVVAPIFQGISEEEFLMELLSTNPAWVWLQVLKNEQDLPVGFQVISLYEYPFEGFTCGLFRADTGLLPA